MVQVESSKPGRTPVPPPCTSSRQRGQLDRTQAPRGARRPCGRSTSPSRRPRSPRSPAASVVSPVNARVPVRPSPYGPGTGRARAPDRRRCPAATRRRPRRCRRSAAAVPPSQDPRPGPCGCSSGAGRRGRRPRWLGPRRRGRVTSGRSTYRSTVSPASPARPYSTATSRSPIAACVMISEVEYTSLAAAQVVAGDEHLGVAAVDGDRALLRHARVVAVRAAQREGGLVVGLHPGVGVPDDEELRAVVGVDPPVDAQRRVGRDGGVGRVGAGQRLCTEFTK